MADTKGIKFVMVRTGTRGIAIPQGSQYKVEYQNGVKTLIDSNIVEESLSKGFWKRK